MNTLLAIKWLAQAGLAILVTGCVLLAGYSLLFTGNVPSNTKADLIMVFPGTPERIEAGYRLAIEGRARLLAISGIGAKGFKTKESLLAGNTDVACIPTAKSRTTFEDAYNTRIVVQQHGVRSVLLVTSSWHMPRSFMLLRCLLIGTGVEILPVPVDECVKFGENGRECTTFWLKMIANEMIKTWGSSMELAWEGMSGDLLMDRPGYRATSAFLKKKMLF